MRLRYSWRLDASPHPPFDECRGFAGWVAGRNTRHRLLVEATSEGGGAPLVAVAYHHDGPADWRPDARLRRAMRQLAAMRADLAPGFPTPVRVEHWAFPEKRKMPRPGETVGAQHVNGGCTRRGDTIHCYRQEQYPKVWLHEAAHAFGIDHHSSAAPSELTRALRAALPTTAPLLPNEAWAELVAGAYSTACIPGAAFGSRRWKAAWATETEHAFAQAGALCRHMGHARAEDIFRRPGRERTNALAYYVLRSALMPRPEEWPRVKSAADLVALILERLRQPEFLARLQRGMDAPPARDRNLRMTARA